MDMEHLVKAYFDSTGTIPLGRMPEIAREVHEEQRRRTFLDEIIKEYADRDSYINL